MLKFGNEVNGMKLCQIYKEEVFKITRKPITLVLLIALILPLFYGVSIIVNAKHVIVQGDFDAILFASVNWNMLTMTGVPEILFALITTHIFAYEIERGQIRLLYLRVCDRKKMLLSKMLAMLTMMLGFYVIYYFWCFGIYYIFIVQTPLGNGMFLSSISSMQYMVMDLIYLIQIMIVCSLVFCLGLKFKAFVSFMMGIGLTTVFIVFQFFPTIKYLVPAYIATALSQQIITTHFALILCFVYLGISFIPAIMAIKKFGRVDIK